MTKPILVPRKPWVIFTWLCTGTGCGTSGAWKHHCWKLWGCPSPTQTHPFWLFSHPPTSPIWTRFCQCGRRERNLFGWVTTQGEHMVQNQWRGPCLWPESMTQWLWGRWNPCFISLGGPRALERQGAGIPVGPRWWISPTDKGANCFHFTPTPSPRTVLWPNQISGLPADLAHPKPRATPPPCRHLPSPKAHPEDMVRKLKNSWVCGDKLCGFAL